MEKLEAVQKVLRFSNSITKLVRRQLFHLLWWLWRTECKWL